MMSQPRLIAVGDNCLDAYLTKDALTIGGNALNVAVQWHNLGADSRYFGAVGRDEEANLVVTAIEQAGLAPQDVDEYEGKTAITLIANEMGERRFLFESLGVGENYFPRPTHYQQLLACNFVHLGTRAHPQLVRRLSDDGVRFSIDLSNLPFEHLDLDRAALVFASGGDEGEAALSLLETVKQKGAGKILLTCGAHGAYYHEDKQILHVPARSVDVIDTCGAGDAFVARFVLALFFERQAAHSALDTATQYAAKICTHPGGFVQPVHPIPDWLRAKYAHFIQPHASLTK